MSDRMMTELGLKALKPKPKYFERAIGGRLRVGVYPTGHKSFLIRYRYPRGGRSRKLIFQHGITLAAARRAAADAFYQLEQGIDPGVAKQQLQRTAQETARQQAADTFEAICREYLHREGSKLRSAKHRLRQLQVKVLPTLGTYQISAVRRSDIIRLLDRIEEREGLAAADNTLALLRRIFNWHAARTDDFKTPIVRGMARRNAKLHARARILDDDELRAVWIAAAADGLFGVLVQFILLTACRRAEADHMRWLELSGTNWALPASRNKTKVDLVRPLSSAAQEVLAQLPRTAGFVFSLDPDGDRAFGGMQQRKARFDKACGVTGWTMHDLRRTARSLMSRAGVPVDHAERCLGHAIGGVRATYDRHQYQQEMAKAYEALALQIQRIVHPVDNVTPLHSSVAVS
jgi:integrase